MIMSRKKQAYEIVHNYNIVDDLIHDAFIKLIPKISLLHRFIVN